MEIVKRIEGPVIEEEDVFDFEEEKEIHQEPRVEKPKRAKKPIGLPLPLLGLLAVLLLGYFGFKFFSEQSTPPTEVNKVAMEASTEKGHIDKEPIATEPIIKEESTNNRTIIETQEEHIAPNVIVHKVTEASSEKEVSKALNQVVIYTEELAQELKPEKEEIIKELVVTHETPAQKVETTTPTKEILPPTIVSIQAAPEKIVAPKEEVTPQKVVKKKPVIKKRQAKVAKRKQRVITIKKGDTLASISQKYYGNAMEFRQIIRANRSLRSAKTALKPGQEIIVPYPPKHKQRRFVIARKGYSLAYISKKFYGTISEIERIVAANPEIKNKNSTLKIGQKVYVPK